MKSRIAVVLSASAVLIAIFCCLLVASEQQKAMEAEQRAHDAESRLEALQSTCDRQQKAIKRLHDQLDEQKARADTADALLTRIGLIVDGSSFYHRRTCPVFLTAKAFRAYTTEQCKNLGYGGCPVCVGPPIVAP